MSHQSPKNESRTSLTRYAWLSIAAAVVTIALKSGAYLLTGSVGLLSDAIESGVNLVAALMALAMLTVAARPEDDNHAYGHSKAEYFASVVEGILILVAAGGIIWTAAGRLFQPKELEQVGVGLAVSVGASLINLAVAQILLRAGKKNNSITLEADSHHLMTDVWTSVGVVAAIGVVGLTGWLILDPIIAIAVGLNIVWTAYHLIRRSVEGLMDGSLPPEEQKQIEEVIAQYRQRGVEFHALRTRQSAARRFVSVHVLVPGAWTLHDAHHVAEDFEGDIRRILPETIVHTHLEPIDDEISMEDIHEK
ncbi:MAG: cation transporter [Chloroflexi bacterium]|nr:cation transporter [Chloroflexota bacterium]